MPGNQDPQEFDNPEPGLVVDNDGESHHIVNHIFTSTAVFQGPGGEEDRWVYAKLSMYFVDSHPPISVLINMPLAAGIIVDLGKALKEMFGIVDEATEAPDTVPANWLDVPPPTDTDYMEGDGDDRYPGREDQ